MIRKTIAIDEKTINELNNYARRKQKEKIEKEALRAAIKAGAKYPKSGKFINIQSAR